MNTKNPYEHLKIDCLADVEPVEAQSTWTVTEGREETVKILTSLLPDGMWVFGYSVFWANGRFSFRKPTAELGLFRAQRDAKLYAIGFMLIYLNYFLEQTRLDIRRGEAALIQTELFNL